MVASVRLNFTFENRKEFHCPFYLSQCNIRKEWLSTIMLHMTFSRKICYLTRDKLPRTFHQENFLQYPEVVHVWENRLSLQGVNLPLSQSGGNGIILYHEAELIKNVILSTLKCSLGIQQICRDIVGGKSILVLKWTIETFGFEAMFCVKMYQILDC